jgi:hypothetical protein
MLVENAVQQPVIFRWVGAQLSIRVENASVFVIAMQLQNVASTVRDGLRTHEGVGGGNNGRFDAPLPKRVLQQPVEVRREDDADVACPHQLGGRKVCLGRNLATFVSVLLGRLDVSVQDRAALLGR